MTTHAMHWHEGQLVRPQHFQSAERSLRAAIGVGESWLSGYPYGLRVADLDVDALANWEFRLRRCHARLKDGTQIRFPEDALLNPVPIPRSVFDRAETLMVHLAVPRLELGRHNADAGDDRHADARFRVEEFEVDDENAPGYPVPMQIRRPNARLLLGGDELAAFETVPVARLRRGATAEASPAVDPGYIPPLLACDAWRYLQDELLKNVHDHLRGRLEEESRIAADRGVSFESGVAEDGERLAKLQALNTSVGYLHNLPFVRGLHPLPVYMELCRIVGLISLFRTDWSRRFPNLPHYDHDDLGGCFHAIRNCFAIDRPDEPARAYEKRVFKGDGLQMRVRLESEWLESSWRFFIGVESQLKFAEVERLLLQTLNIKVGASDEVDDLFFGRKPGVTLIPTTDAPRVLPSGDWTYWQIDRTSYRWKRVEQTLNLAIRFNEEQVIGGQDGLTGRESVEHRGEEGDLIGLKFVLYAVPRSPESIR